MRGLVVGLLLTLTACEPAPSEAPQPATSQRAPTFSPSPTKSVPASSTPAPDSLESLQGNTRNAIAWAPLAAPDDITVEGSVPRSRAWSTSKVLVIAAYLDEVVDGDPTAIPDTERDWIHAALTRSDGPSVTEIRKKLDDPGDAMTDVLREIGDTTTAAPDSYEGTMQWTVGEQVRFMAALGTGRVVSPEASRFLLDQMQPIASQQWGLASIGANAFKPGWVGVDTETRQMGIVGNYAVAIITAGDGPVTLQSDGDYAHQWQLDRLARLLAQRIG